MANKKIAVIGAGIGGLTLAYRLIQKGRSVTIYEKSSDVGGLMGGFTIAGTSLEKTYHHIFKTDTDAINLINELGLEDKLTWAESSIGLYYEHTLSPFATPLDLLKFPQLNIFDKLRSGLVALYLQRLNNYQPLIPIKAHQWMKKYCGSNFYQVVWEPLLKGKFHQHYDNISMAWLWARIHTRINSKDRDGLERLGYLLGGFNQITQALVKKIGPNNIKTNTEIKDFSSIKADTSSILVLPKKLTI